jgi:hypothetical protein
MPRELSPDIPLTNRVQEAIPSLRTSHPLALRHRIA